MNRLTCIIVDDEPLALDLLNGYVKKTPFLDCRAKCSNAFEALELLANQPVDLVFLDIQMPELSGIELSRMIGPNTRVVFTTAFDHYALEGFKVNALDYLLKPFNYEEFLKATNRAREWFARHSLKEPPSKHDFIFVKSEYKQVKIDLSEVLYFEGLKDYVKIWLSDQPKPVMSIMSLKSLEEELPPRFMRIHRSYIVALDRIQSVERSQVIINKTVRITVADQYREKFQEFLSGNSLH